MSMSLDAGKPLCIKMVDPFLKSPRELFLYHCQWRLRCQSLNEYEGLVPSLVDFGSMQDLDFVICVFSAYATRRSDFTFCTS